MIKTFRGLIVDGGQDKINLHTGDGAMGYRIIKFELFPAKFGYFDQKSTVTIFKIPQTTSPSSLVDFSESTLLGASCLSTDNSEANPLNITTIFDQEVFNQDIYLAHNDAHSDANPVNYYLELEQIKLSDNENTVATLKDIKANA